MDYFLRVLAIGQSAKIKIDENEFQNLVRAKELISYFIKLTENYRVVVESFRAVERAKHDVELDHILYSKLSYKDFSDARVAVNSPIVGYLASARYFIDSTDKILSKFLSAEQVESFNQFRSQIYDTINEYRFVEALRNYVQHRRLHRPGISRLPLDPTNSLQACLSKIDAPSVLKH